MSQTCRQDFPSPLLNKLGADLISFVLFPVASDLHSLGKLSLALTSKFPNAAEGGRAKATVLPEPFTNLIKEVICAAGYSTVSGRQIRTEDIDFLVGMPGTFFSPFESLERLEYPRCTNWTAKDIAALPPSLFVIFPAVLNSRPLIYFSFTADLR